MPHLDLFIDKLISLNLLKTALNLAIVLWCCTPSKKTQNIIINTITKVPFSVFQEIVQNIKVKKLLLVDCAKMLVQHGFKAEPYEVLKTNILELS